MSRCILYHYNGHFIAAPVSQTLYVQGNAQHLHQNGGQSKILARHRFFIDDARIAVAHQVRDDGVEAAPMIAVQMARMNVDKHHGQTTAQPDALQIEL